MPLPNGYVVLHAGQDDDGKGCAVLEGVEKLGAGPCVTVDTDALAEAPDVGQAQREGNQPGAAAADLQHGGDEVSGASRKAGIA